MEWYRFQNRHYNGIYRGGDETGSGFYDVIGSVETNPRHPPPHHDSKLLEGVMEFFEVDEEDALTFFGSFIYGFESLAQLHSWIYKNEWIRGLYEKGFAVYLYRVPSIVFINGNTQAVVDSEWFYDNYLSYTKMYTLDELIK